MSSGLTSVLCQRSVAGLGIPGIVHKVLDSPQYTAMLVVDVVLNPALAQGSKEATATARLFWCFCRRVIVEQKEGDDVFC